MSTIDSDNKQPNGGNKTPVNSDSNLMAALSYVWVISIVMLVIKKDDPFVSFHAKQGTVLFAFSILGMVLTPLITPIVFILGPIVSIIIVIGEVIGFIKALSGEKYKIPIVGDLAEKINI